VAVSEAVVEWLSLGAREELPEGLCTGDCEAQTLALGDTLPPRLLLGQGEEDVDKLLLRLTLEHCEAVAEATPLPLAVPRGEEEGVSIWVPEVVAEAYGEADPPSEALGLPVKPLREGAGERVMGEAVTETLPLTERLSESDCVGHWLAEGEPVADGLSLVEREANPVALSVGECETLALALSDALTPLLALTVREGDCVSETERVSLAVEPGEGDPPAPPPASVALGLSEPVTVRLPLAEGL
jgi:hypothetical protein